MENQQRLFFSFNFFFKQRLFLSKQNLIRAQADELVEVDQSRGRVWEQTCSRQRGLRVRIGNLKIFHIIGLRVSLVVEPFLHTREVLDSPAQLPTKTQTHTHTHTHTHTQTHTHTKLC
jgi:hypothetical protein